MAEQDRCLPELALILQATAPTGAEAFTANRTLPGLNLCYGWGFNDCCTGGGSASVNGAVDGLNRGYAELAASFSFNFKLTEKWGTFIESYVISPHGALDPRLGPQNYVDGGFTFRPNYNLQFDVNAGVGLNQHADDWFVGAGCVIRF